MRRNKYGEVALVVSLAVAAVLLAGCVVCQKDEQYTGIRDETLRKVECGQTTKGEIVEMFGEPSEQAVSEGGAEVLKYKCVKKKDNQFVMFPPPIVIKDDKAERHTVVFELRDGVVQRYWKKS